MIAFFHKIGEHKVAATLSILNTETKKLEELSNNVLSMLVDDAIKLFIGFAESKLEIKLDERQQRTASAALRVLVGH